jgi:hypothetical protein
MCLVRPLERSEALKADLEGDGRGARRGTGRVARLHDGVHRECFWVRASPKLRSASRC